jgi:acid phosphatase
MLVALLAQFALLATAPAADSNAGVGDAATSEAPLRDTHELLNSVLWIQTSVEYRAVCQGIYAAATRALDEALADPAWTAAVEQEPGYADLPPAVILDLDETVIDNSRLFGEVIRRRVDLLPDRWTTWIARGEADAVPGALEFLATARGKGVKVFFITNRNTRGRAATFANLRALGIDVEPAELMMAGEQGWTTDKTERRRAVARQYRVLLVFGDVLHDFLATDDSSPETRLASAADYAAWWGRRWFMFPNPLTGNWLSAISRGVGDDAAVLQRMHELVRGFDYE